MMMAIAPSTGRVPGRTAARHCAPFMLPVTAKPPTVRVTITEVRTLQYLLVHYLVDEY